MPDINWTTVITSAIVASIISSMQFVTTRYLGRILDRLEKTSRLDKGKGTNDT